MSFERDNDDYDEPHSDDNDGTELLREWQEQDYERCCSCLDHTAAFGVICVLITNVCLYVRDSYFLNLIE